MKKIVMIIGFLGVFIMLVGLPSAFAAGATHERFSSGWVPFEQTRTNTCLDESEDIHITGLNLGRYEYILEPSGGYTFASLILWRGTGEGLTTGARYRFSVEWPWIDSSCSPSSACNTTFVVPVHLISLDPNVPDSFAKSLVHTTIDAKGELRVDIDSFEAVCR